MSNGIRKASWKEEHVIADSPDTDQHKLLQISTLRKNQKMCSGEEKKKPNKNQTMTKTKQKRMAS